MSNDFKYFLYELCPMFIRRRFKQSKCAKRGHVVYEVGFNLYSECGVCGDTDIQDYDGFWALTKGYRESPKVFGKFTDEDTDARGNK